MASNLSCIGFDFADEDAFSAAVERLATEASERLATPAGDYAIWRSRTGAELWFHLAPSDAGTSERAIVGLTPFFEGRSEIPVKLTARFRRPEDNDFEGAWSAWVAPDDSGEGAYPVLFDIVDAGACNVGDLPRNATVRLTGFARTLRAYPSAQAYHAGADRKLPLAEQAFIPTGLFAAAADDHGNDDNLMPSSNALLSGRVLDYARLTNEETGRTFVWLLIESLEATYDVVADPSIIEGTPVVGGTVEAGCWLVGRTLT